MREIKLYEGDKPILMKMTQDGKTLAVLIERQEMECAVDMMMMDHDPNAIPDEESDDTMHDIYQEDHVSKHLILIDISNLDEKINIRHEISVGEEVGDLIITHTGTLVATIEGGFMELY